MHLEWQLGFQIEEDALGYIDKIVENNGMFYAIVFENMADKQHVAIFDKNGGRHGEIRDAINKSTIFMYNNGHLATEGETVTLYSLPHFSETATMIDANVGDITAIPSTASPADFCVYTFRKKKTDGIWYNKFRRNRVADFCCG